MPPECWQVRLSNHRALCCITAVIVILKTLTICLSALCNAAQGRFSSVISKWDGLPTQHNPVQKHEQGSWKQQSRSTCHLFMCSTVLFGTDLFNLSGVLLGPEQLPSCNSSALHLLILKAPWLNWQIVVPRSALQGSYPVAASIELSFGNSTTLTEFGFFLFWGW